MGLLVSFTSPFYFIMYSRTFRYLPFPVPLSSVLVAPRCLVVYTVDNKLRIQKKKKKKYKDDFGVSHTIWTPGAILPRSSIILQRLLHDDGLRAMGEKAAEFKSLHPFITPGSMYMFSKCYVGFCTPRRTKIESKKKKKGQK